MSELPLSVVMIAFNEEDNITRCLSSLPNHCEVVVLDSGSSDSTKRIAIEWGAIVAERPFDDYASQRNHAATLAHRDWLLVVDCDEVLSPELRGFLEQNLSDINAAYDRESVTAYRIRRRLWFMGKLLRFGKTEDAPIRLFRRQSGQYQGKVHEVFTPETGMVSNIQQGHLTHYSYVDLQDYFFRFNRYTSMIAEKHGDAGRRTWLATAYLRMLWEFFSRMILRLAWLDGWQGIVFASLSSGYAFVKYLKLYEQNRARQ